MKENTPGHPERVRVLPLTGMALVFRQQLRRRCTVRDLLAMLSLLAALLAIAVVLRGYPLLTMQTPFATTLETDRSGGPNRGMLRLLEFGSIGAVLLLAPCAAAMGAGAAPPRSEFEATQSALLTRLSSRDICGGRLLAGLWPLFTTLAASLTFWLVLQWRWRVVPEENGGTGALFTAYFVLLSTLLMAGALGFLFALRPRPGRAWHRGLGVALVWVTGCIMLILLVNPLLLRMTDPVRIIEGALLVNPVAASTTAFHWDILRAGRLYALSYANEYPYQYPAPLLSATLFALIGLGAFLLSAVRLRCAYR